MKKTFRFLVYFLGFIVVLAIGFITFIQIRGIPSYEAKDPGVKVQVTPERVANGKKIVSMLCANCHLDNETGKFTGKFLDDIPKEFGEIYSRNITQHPTKGIGGWTDGQLLYLLRTGIGKDGRYRPVYMPKFAHMSDEDINSVVAFLHSDDPWVAPSDVDNRECKVTFLDKFLCLVAFKPIPFPQEKIVAPDRKDKVAYGKYIVTGKVECYPCHSRDFKTMNIGVPEKSEGFMGGGNTLMTHEGKKILSANLTMDKQTGIGNWTEAEFIKAVKYGITPHGPVRYPMVPLSALDSDEISSVYAYLKTIPPIRNSVDRGLRDE